MIGEKVQNRISDYEPPAGVGIGDREADIKFILKVLSTPSARFWTNALAKEGEGDGDWQRS